MIRPTHCYLGLSKDGKLEIMVSDRTLSPLGTRFLRGDKFPAAVYDFYGGERICPKEIKAALAGAEAYLRGEETGAAGLTVGDTSPLNTKRTRKK